MDTKSPLTVRIEPKIHWLASYAAVERGMTLAEFVESLLRKSLVPETLEALFDADPTPGSEPKSQPRLNHEELWDDDSETRLYNIATHFPDWLSRSETQIWGHYSAHLALSHRKPSAKSFREYRRESR